LPIPALRFPQPLEEDGELGCRDGCLVGEQARDPDDVLLGDLRHVGGPGLPVAPLADLLDDLGVDRVAPLLDPERQRELGRVRGPVLFAAAAAAVDDENLVGMRGVEVDLVDHGVEPVVVGAQRLQHLPDDLETLVVAQSLLGRDPGRDDDGQDDVAEVLAGGLAHDPPDRLDDVDLGAAGGQEHDRVEGGDVDAFGEAARVGQHPAYVLAGGGAFLEPLEQVAALEGVHRPVDVPDLDAQLAFRSDDSVTGHSIAVVHGGTEPVDDAGEGDGGGLGRLDVLGKRHGPAHRGQVDALHPVGQVRAEPLGQAVPAADELGRVAELQLAGGAELLLEVLRHECLVDGQDEDLVVGEQVTLYGLAEPEPVQDRAEDGFVVHRREHRVVGVGLLLGVRVEQARGGGHVQALGPAQVGVVVDPDEVRLVRLGQGDAGGAVGLVADDQVEVGHPLALGAGDDVDRLVGGEDDGELVVLGALADLRGQGLGVRGRGVDQVVDREVLRGVGLADLHVGAHGIRAEGDLGLLLPLAQALVEQLDRGDEEQDGGGLGLAAGRELLGDLERGERLAGPAGHDQLAAVMRGQSLADRRPGLPLVRQGGLLAGGRQDLLGPRPVDSAPVDLGLQQVDDPDPHDRAVRLSSCFSIVGPQSLAVETMIRLVNPFLLDAARKESTSALAT